MTEPEEDSRSRWRVGRQNRSMVGWQVQRGADPFKTVATNLFHKWEAQLIAAAPALLDAAKVAAIEMERTQATTGEDSQALEMIRAAIDAAEGRQEKGMHI